jgi:hypothetical protein
MGGVWAYVWAESEEEIARKLDVEVVREVPDWLVNDKSGLVTLDLDQPLDWPRPD